MGVLDGPVARAIQSVYEAGFSTDLWQDGLTELCRSVDAHAAITVPRLDAAEALYLPYSPEIEDLAKDFVDNRWYERDFRAQHGWPLTDAGQFVILEQDIATPGDHATSPIHQEFFLRHGVLWWAGVTFRAIGRQYCLSIHRTPGQGPFDESHRRIFQGITGHLSRAMTMAEQMARAAGRGGLGILDAMEHGCILVDARGAILEMNAIAEKLLGDGLTVRGNRLTAEDSASNARMRRIIGRTLLYGPQQERSVPIRRRLRRPLLLDVMPLPMEVASGFFFAKALVILIDPDRALVPSAQRLRMMFLLSPAEAAVAVRIGAGLGIREVAEALEIRPETVRTHLKAVFAKTDTNRQSDLVALLHRIGVLSRPD